MNETSGQAQSCVSQSAAEHEAEQQRLADRTRVQQEVNQQQIDPRRYQVHMQPGYTPAAGSDGLAGPDVRTPFSDRPILDRVEALRREVRRLRAANATLHNLLSAISAQIQNLRQHEHVNGKVMVPADSFAHPLGLIQGMGPAGSSYDPLA